MKIAPSGLLRRVSNIVVDVQLHIPEKIYKHFWYTLDLIFQRLTIGILTRLLVVYGRVLLLLRKLNQN